MTGNAFIMQTFLIALISTIGLTELAKAIPTAGIHHASPEQQIEPNFGPNQFNMFSGASYFYSPPLVMADHQWTGPISSIYEQNGLAYVFGHDVNGGPIAPLMRVYRVMDPVEEATYAQQYINHYWPQAWHSTYGHQAAQMNNHEDDVDSSAYPEVEENFQDSPNFYEDHDDRNIGHEDNDMSAYVDERGELQPNHEPFSHEETFFVDENVAQKHSTGADKRKDDSVENPMTNDENVNMNMSDERYDANFPELPAPQQMAPKVHLVPVLISKSSKESTAGKFQLAGGVKEVLAHDTPSTRLSADVIEKPALEITQEKIEVNDYGRKYDEVARNINHEETVRVHIRDSRRLRQQRKKEKAAHRQEKAIIKFKKIKEAKHQAFLEMKQKRAAEAAAAAAAAEDDITIQHVDNETTDEKEISVHESDVLKDPIDSINHDYSSEFSAQEAHTIPGDRSIDETVIETSSAEKEIDMDRENRSGSQIIATGNEQDIALEVGNSSGNQVTSEAQGATPIPYPGPRRGLITFEQIINIYRHSGREIEPLFIRMVRTQYPDMSDKRVKYYLDFLNNVNLVRMHLPILFEYFKQLNKTEKECDKIIKKFDVVISTADGQKKHSLMNKRDSQLKEKFDTIQKILDKIPQWFHDLLIDIQIQRGVAARLVEPAHIPIDANHIIAALKDGDEIKKSIDRKFGILMKLLRAPNVY